MKLNRVELSGNVGNIDIFETEGKKPFARVSLAENDRYTNKNGETFERTTWHKLVFYGNVVSVLKDKVAKGSHLIVFGRLSYQDWEAEDGTKRQSAYVVVSQFQVSDHKKQVEAESFDSENFEADEIPF